MEETVGDASWRDLEKLPGSVKHECVLLAIVSDYAIEANAGALVVLRHGFAAVGMIRNELQAHLAVAAGGDVICAERAERAGGAVRSLRIHQVELNGLARQFRSESLPIQRICIS